MKNRHSVRRYNKTPIEPQKREVFDSLINRFNLDDDVHIQIFYDEPDCFDSFMARYGKFEGVSNYIALVGKKSPATEEKLGYYGEQLVLKAQELSCRTCYAALTHGKSKSVVSRGEKEVCLIALGYSDLDGIEHKNKPLREVCNYSSESPAWFIDGVKAALLAPTAMNQQKFFFTLLPDGTVTLSSKKGFYTKLDMGIARYHFEAVTGKKVSVSL